MMKKLISVVALTLSVCLMGAVQADGLKSEHHGMRHGDGPIPLHRLAKVLDLSDSQIEEFKLLKQASKENRGQRHFEDSAMYKLEQLDTTASDYDYSVNELAELRGEQAKEQFLSMAEMRQKMQEILTPEQLEKFKSIKEKRSKKDKLARKES